MEMAEWSGASESKCPVVQGVQEFPWNLLPCLTNITWVGGSMFYTSPSLTLVPSLTQAVLPYI